MVAVILYRIVTMKFFILLPLFLIGAQATAELEVQFEWKQLSFSWTNETFKNESISSGAYIVENNLPLGLAIWENKLFVSVPRWKSGVAASLTYIDLNTTTEMSPELIPYPDWETHDLKSFSSSQTIVSPFRMNVDACDRLWFVDTGIADVLGTNTVYRPITLTAINLTTDEIIFQYELKSTDQTTSSIFANIVVDVNEFNCNNAYVYMTDLGGYGLVVYSLSQNDSWRFTHNFFYFEPLLGNFDIGGVNFQWNDGIFGSALGPRERDGYRTFYFHPFVSNNEFSVNTKTLRNKSLATNNDYFLWTHEGNKGRNSASLVSVFDEIRETLIMSLPQKNGIGCWNTRNMLITESFPTIARNRTTLVFPNDLKIDENRNLWALSDKLPVFMYSTLNPDETNFRILKANVDDLIADTYCDI